jgi:hypothetical protein
MFPKLKGMKELVPFYGGCEMILHLLYTLQYRSERCLVCHTTPPPTKLQLRFSRFTDN